MNKGTAGADGDRAQELVKQVPRPHPSLSLASHLIRPSISPPVVQIRGHEVALAELNNLHPSRVSGTSSVLLVIFLLAIGEEVTLFRPCIRETGISSSGKMSREPLTLSRVSIFSSA